MKELNPLDNRQLKTVSVVIPVLNESENIPHIINRLDSVLQPLPYEREYIFVNDGSTDNSIEVLQNFNKRLPYVEYLDLSRNFGHQNALKAGLDSARGDCVISIDGDLQHPPELISVFLSRWEEGYDIIYTRRRSSKKNSFFKNSSSDVFYAIVNRLSEVKLEPGTADFRLIDRRVAEVLKEFREIDPFLRGIVKWVGFSQYAIDYHPDERLSGRSKYTLKKMIKLALQGVTSFSIRPLYSAVLLGFGFSAISVLYLPYILYSLYFGHAISGWASILISIVFFGGLQLMILGIVGIYIGKIFLQTKNRPGYIVKETSFADKDN